MCLYSKESYRANRKGFAHISFGRAPQLGLPATSRECRDPARRILKEHRLTHHGAHMSKRLLFLVFVSLLLVSLVLGACQAKTQVAQPATEPSPTPATSTFTPKPTATPLATPTVTATPTTAATATVASPPPTATPQAGDKEPTPGEPGDRPPSQASPSPTPTRPWQVPEVREDDWVKGEPNAGLVLVAYSDFQ